MTALMQADPTSRVTRRKESLAARLSRPYWQLGDGGGSICVFVWGVRVFL